jgi:SAM-dependent methyltransferase
MTGLSDDAQAVGTFYDGAGFEFEVARLDHYHPVERAMTARYLARYVPEGSTVADIGVGAGHYDELLAQRGCTLHLADVSRHLLDTALARLDSAGRRGQVADARIASAVDLAHLPTAGCDAVLLLGPLYHLLTLEDRLQAVGEAKRILRPHGVLIATACNRLAALSTGFRGPECGAETHAANARFVNDGIVDPELAPTIGFAHFTYAEEFSELFADGFEELLFAGVESFTGNRQAPFLDLPGADQEAWLDLIEQTATMRDGMGLSEHLIYIGRNAPE